MRRKLACRMLATVKSCMSVEMPVEMGCIRNLSWRWEQSRWPSNLLALASTPHGSVACTQEISSDGWHCAATICASCFGGDACVLPRPGTSTCYILPVGRPQVQQRVGSICLSQLFAGLAGTLTWAALRYARCGNRLRRWHTTGRNQQTLSPARWAGSDIHPELSLP